MWLGKMAGQSDRESTPAVEAGRTTIGGAAPAALCGQGEYRELKILSPGGYVWRPSAGKDVLLLKDSGERMLLAGQEQGEGFPSMQEGEVRILSAGGAEIRLLNSGVIELRGDVSLLGRVDVTGELYINGVACVPGLTL